MQKILWTQEKIALLFELTFFELIEQAYEEHKAHHNPTEIELCVLSSIKTGACPEDCAYCPQSAHYNTNLKREKLIDITLVKLQAKKAKQQGAKRFCMGAAWKNPPKKEFPKVLEMIREVKKMGLETCVTLGMLTDKQAHELKENGLDYYNHNLDTSKNYYNKIISTRQFQERLDTIQHIINADISVCCGGILGMGESREDRVGLLYALSQLPKAPQSIPINKLIRIKGTPLEDATEIDSFEFIRTIAITRIMFPTAMIRLSAGRAEMNDEMQAWCYMAGANSIFVGDKLLTAKNPTQSDDITLFNKLDIHASTAKNALA